MAYNGSGTFLINTAGQPVVAGTVISSTTFNALTADLATGLSTVITKDGQTTVTANIPMASFKFTGLGVGSAAGDSANLSQVQSTVTKLLASVSGADTVTATASPTLAAYAAGQMFYFVAAGDNTTSVTLNIDALGAKAVTRDGSVALAAADIKSGEVVVVVYDGTRFQVVSQLNSAGNATFANVSITSALNVGGVATFSAGTAAAPSITTTGDTNTGIFFPAADTIAFTEGGVEAGRFDSSGNLGIGTASPQAKLAVSNGGANGYELDPVNGFISAYNRSTNAWTKITTRASSYTFNLNNTNDALNIDSSGSLGLGVTPSAWDSGFQVLENQGGSLSSGSNAAVRILQNAYFATSYKYKFSSVPAGRYELASGAHQWFTAASGTAGNAISFTQAMTLDASGNLLVGTTTAICAGTFSSSANSGQLAVTGASQNSIKFASSTGGSGWIVGRSLSANNANDFFIFDHAANTNRLFISNDGEVRIAGDTDQGVYNLQVNGTGVWGAGAYVNGSDARLKDNIQSLDSGLDVVKAIRPVTFQYKPEYSKDQSVQPGFIAQELQAAMAGKAYLDGVVHSGPEHLNVAYQNIIPILVKAIQELSAKVTALESK